MMFSRLYVVNAFFTHDIVPFTMGLSGRIPIASGGASYLILIKLSKWPHAVQGYDIGQCNPRLVLLTFFKFFN